MTEPGTDYFLEIEARFAERRGTPFLFSAKDWSLMKSWSDDGIPLSIVLEAIDKCFDNSVQAGRRRTISSLSYCRHAVKDLWGERKDLFVGDAETIPEQSTVEILARLGESLRNVAAANTHLSRPLESAAMRITSLRGAGPEIEAALIEVENTLLGELGECLSAEDRTGIEGEIGEMMAGISSLDAKAMERTRDANFRRLMRSRFGLPRLSLFG